METAPAFTPDIGRQSTPRSLIAALIAVVALIAFLVFNNVFKGSYINLLPDRTDDEFDCAFAVGIAAMVATITALLYYRPTLRAPLVVSIPVLGFVALLVGSMLSIAPTEVLFSTYDFRYRPLVGFDAFVRVSRFYVSHERGMAYRLALTDFNPTLSLYYDDYRWNTGGREDVAVPGKCILVRLERSGQALRMIQPKHVHAVPCPANPKLLQLG